MQAIYHLSVSRSLPFSLLSMTKAFVLFKKTQTIQSTFDQMVKVIWSKLHLSK